MKQYFIVWRVNKNFIYETEYFIFETLFCWGVGVGKRKPFDKHQSQRHAKQYLLDFATSCSVLLLQYRFYCNRICWLSSCLRNFFLLVK